MKRIILLLLLIAVSSAQAGDKEIFTAMKTEIERAMKNLRIEDMDPPYFISLRMFDLEERSISASFGVSRRMGRK